MVLSVKLLIGILLSLEILVARCLPMVVSVTTRDFESIDLAYTIIRYPCIAIRYSVEILTRKNIPRLTEPDNCSAFLGANCSQTKKILWSIEGFVISRYE